MACAPNRITLKTIAEHCDCSVNTVSLALRNDSRISEATLRKVQQAADELGYIRNNLASSLRSGKSHMIAVIIEHAHNPHYTFLIDDIVAELRTHGYIPLLLFTHSSEETEQQMLKLALSLSADGIILFVHGTAEHSAKMLRSLTLPVILIDRGVPGTEMDCVCVNDYDGGYLAGQKLTRLSHSRFLYIAGPPTIESQIRRQQEFFMHCRTRIFHLTLCVLFPSKKSIAPLNKIPFCSFFIQSTILQSLPTTMNLLTI